MRQKDNTNHHENHTKFPATIFAARDPAVVTVQLLLGYSAKGTSVGSLLNFNSLENRDKSGFLAA